MKYQDINKLIQCRDFCSNDLKIVMLNKQKKNKENNINCLRLWYTLCIYDSDQRWLSFYQYLKIFSFPPNYFVLWTSGFYSYCDSKNYVKFPPPMFCERFADFLCCNLRIFCSCKPLLSLQVKQNINIYVKEQNGILILDLLEFVF